MANALIFKNLLRCKKNRAFKKKIWFTYSVIERENFTMQNLALTQNMNGEPAVMLGGGYSVVFLGKQTIVGAPQYSAISMGFIFR